MVTKDQVRKKELIKEAGALSKQLIQVNKKILTIETKEIKKKQAKAKCKNCYDDGCVECTGHWSYTHDGHG